jgi:predicted nucleic acid-binding protein
MTTWIDTNVLVALWSGDVEARASVRAFMQEAAEVGWFAVSACVYAEFLAGPDRTQELVTEFLSEAEIPIAWHTGQDVWLLAAERYAEYVQARRAGRPEPKRFVADFLIGAQATVRGGRLMTFDQRLYAAAFPELKLIGRVSGVPPPGAN